MKNSKANIVLIFTSVVPVILLMWPFAWWGDAAGLILRVIPSLSVQALLCNTIKNGWLKTVPLALTALAALWGIYLFFTSASWVNATVGGLVADYISPFICCAIVYAVYRLKKQ